MKNLSNFNVEEINSNEALNISGGFGALLAGVAIFIAGSALSYQLGKDFYHLTK